MKILALVAGLDPARAGIASAATSMSIAARRAGVECVVAVPDHGEGDGSPSALILELERAGVEVHVLPVVPWAGEAAYRWGISPAQIVWTVRNLRSYDLVHVHGPWSLGAFSGLLVGRLTRTPVVVTAHESLTSFDIDTSRSEARRRQKLALKSLYLRYASLFVLNSEIEARTSLPLAAPQRTVYLPVGGAEAAVPALRPRGEGPDLRVGFLGRIHPKKNLDLLIDALGELPNHVRLVVAGDGPAELVARFKLNAASLGVSDRIDWLGFVDSVARRHLFANIDVLAMPSAFESFGLSAAEAMLNGVPVIVSDRTGIAEVIGRHGGGRIIRPEAAAIVRVIRQLDADRSSLARLAAEGQAAATLDLSQTTIGHALRSAYRDVVATG